jgi:5-methylcytosine-specific restriction enzyme subunit McrC
MTDRLPDSEELEEYVPKSLARERISEDVERVLAESYSAQVQIEAPQYLTGYQWRLTSQGWAGYIPLTAEFGLRLKPKVEIGNLFRMLEYAYRLREPSFRFLDDLIGCQTLEDYYERLANVLAKRVLDRARKGFYRDYVGQEEQLSYVRGRLDVARSAVQPWDVRPHCHYQEHTADIEDNQLLAWTLWDITRRGVCTERVLPFVRQAYRGLQGLTSLQPFPPAACTGRRYNRLNEDYHPLHALCRFFLQQIGPSHRQGDRLVVPFLVNMESLFEMSVAEWLKAHLPPRWRVKAQERYLIGDSNGPRFDIDLVLYDTESGVVRCILDTKYKAPDAPAAADISQVVAYAEAKGCNEAVLIYPIPLRSPLDAHVGKRIQVRSLTFALDGDLEEAGQHFLGVLLQD